LAGRAVFVSASIPDSDRWAGEFDALEITDAVVAVARVVLGNGGVLVTAAHPTIAPLLLYVASEQAERDHPRVVVYQSAVFDSILPDATLRFESDGVGTLIRTAAVGDEPPDPARAPQSLLAMRRQMLTEMVPVAAVFVGGMAGIPDEHELFTSLRPGAPTYALGRPGGAAKELIDMSPAELRVDLAEGDVYPAVARRIVDDLVRALAD
jgi:hypothetical protein